MISDVEVDRIVFAAAKQIERPLVVVCGYCPDARSLTLAAQARGNDVTHGICPECVRRMEDSRNFAVAKSA